jgi:transcription-repair coupling factor (superfamily II helicase)
LDKRKVLPGTFLVHLNHGIGEFLGLTQKNIGGVKKIYLELKYAKDARLFVPKEQLNLLTVYEGLGRVPKLSSLSSKTWSNTKKKVEESVNNLAAELLLIYAKRAMSKSPIFSWPNEAEEMLSRSFPYKLTTDQKKALFEVLNDLKSEKPMDRLICGDVGFGKTEIAIRAAALTAFAGWQTAVLAPTTILVEQHLATFEQRLNNLPLRIARLSRFASAPEVKKILSDLKDGKIDIIIGTHRLLNSDVVFKRLGLVIIDEEQRFGVKHKERFKKLRANVNVLTLSATPIPRTLFLSLSGLRDLSLIETPPLGRQAISTFVAPFSEKVVARAIEAEIMRGGQIYYLFNRVSRMSLKLKQLTELLRKVYGEKLPRIAVAHGQMPEEHLAKVMHDFTRGKIQILLCTTIIQSGLDLNNVNTLIVEEAERFGLADLYQIRGRIGRGYKKAYAYFLYEKGLPQSALRRLQAIAYIEGLGKGFQVALKDLDLRGGGNILGKEQSGNMEAVGLILYTRMLKAAVARLKRKDSLV